MRERRIAIIAALPREIASLVKGVRPDAELRAQGIYCYRLAGAVIVAAGMGKERASLAVAAALRESPGATLISVGLAGSCKVDVKPGMVLECGTVVDVDTGERFSAMSKTTVVLVSTGSIASVAEKARLAASYGASLVDMEAATVARLALAANVSFRAIKAVSDAHDFELESLAQFTGKHGTFRTGAFALHTAMRPWMWGSAATLGRNSSRALAALSEALQAEIG